MRPIHLARLDKLRPVVVLTREAARPVMSSVTVAPITSTIRGLSTEVNVGTVNGLDRESVVSCDNLTTIPATLLGERIGILLEHQERDLARAIVLSFDLDLPLLSGS